MKIKLIRVTLAALLVCVGITSVNANPMAFAAALAVDDGSQTQGSNDLATQGANAYFVCDQPYPQGCIVDKLVTTDKDGERIKPYWGTIQVLYSEYVKRQLGKNAELRSIQYNLYMDKTVVYAFIKKDTSSKPPKPASEDKL